MANRTKKMVFSALFAALVCVATMVIKIPSPLSGYINLGDSVVLLCGWMLGPWYGFLSAAIGSALADLFYGYMVYIPATFLIKGGVALIACTLSQKTNRLVSAVAAEVVMVGAYYVFEGFLYGFGASLVNILPNVIQGAAGITVGLLLAKVFKKSGIQI